MLTLRVVLILSLFVLVAYGIAEWRAVRAGRRPLTRRQRVLRPASFFLLVAVLSMVLAYTWGDRLWSPLFRFFWLSATFILAVPIFPLALYDWREVVRMQLEGEARLFREMAEAERREREKRQSE